MLFCAEFLSNQREIWTKYSQSSLIFCYDFSKSYRYIMFFRIDPGFSWSLYQSAKAKGSICLLLKWADAALGTNVESMLYMSGDSPFIAQWKQEGEQASPIWRPTPPFSLILKIHSSNVV